MKTWIPILLNTYRGGAAIILGILLFFIPDHSRDNLFNLMGFFWLMSGFAVLRRSEDDERYPGQRTALIAGLVIFVAGLLVVTRRFTRQWIGAGEVFFVLGTVLLATGLAHMFYELRLGGITTNRQTGLHFLLSIFEVLLGGLLILSPRMNRPIVYWAAAAWALFYGVMSFGAAVQEFIQTRQEEKGSESAQKPG